MEFFDNDCICFTHQEKIWQIFIMEECIVSFLIFKSY